MPNRLLREGYLTSLKVNDLTPQAESFFVRLMLKADDFGRYDAHPSLLKAALFPLRLDYIREADITRWTAECEKAGLIVLYEVSRKQYLEIPNFGQRMRAATSKYPANDGKKECPPPWQTCDGHDDRHVLLGVGGGDGTSLYSGHERTKVLEVAAMRGVPEPVAAAFYEHYAAIGWLDHCHRPILNFEPKLQQWWRREQESEYKRRNSTPGNTPTWAKAKAMEARISSHPANHESLSYDASNPPTKDQVEELKELRRALKNLRREE